MAAHCGVPTLARRLNVILVEHIRGLLPGLKRRIHEALEVGRGPGGARAGAGAGGAGPKCKKVAGYTFAELLIRG